MRRLLSVTMLILLTIGVCTIALRIQAVKTQPRTWTVDDDDGLSDFHTIQEAVNAATMGDSIQVASGRYHEHVVVNKTLALIGEEWESTIISGDDSGSVMLIVSDDVSMMGFTITNSGTNWNTQTGYSDSGIMLGNVSGCTIARNILTHNLVGIKFDHSSNNNVSGNNLISNLGYAMYLDESSNNVVSGNNLTNSWNGAFFWVSSDNTFAQNNVAANGASGVNMEYSSNNLLRNNTISDSAANFIFSAYTLSEYTNDVDQSNTVNGKPIYFWVNQSNRQVPLDAGCVIIVNSRNITVRDLTLTNNYYGVSLAYTNDSVVQNVIARNNTDGIMLSHLCQRNKIIDNILSENRDSGITLGYDSNDNMIFHNTIAFNQHPAVIAYSASQWDDGSQGNYWSNCNPPDENKDKIGDVPYVIDQNNTDRYPLVYPFECYDPSYVCSPDLNKDGRVNIVDVTKVATAFGSVPGGSNWSPTADLDLNEVINIVDVTKVAKDYGKTV